jgi:hypothetical protein
MIQANELRIGNYLKNNGVVVKIDALSIFHIWDDKLLKNYEPIPLTEEWLLKFGFGKEWETASGVTHKIIHEECFYHKLSDLVIFMRSEIRDIDYPFVSIAKRDVKIQYVHKLQNLYFTLTNTELTLSVT